MSAREIRSLAPPHRCRKIQNSTEKSNTTHNHTIEHGVTEMITGIDIVEQQLRAAAGIGLTIGPDGEIQPHGHAIECRIYAEDPETFQPSPGVLESFVLPDITNVRVDTGYAKGDLVIGIPRSE